MRVDESWRSNASESCNSHQLATSFHSALRSPVEFTTVKIAVNKDHLSQEVVVCSCYIVFKRFFTFLFC